jgi:hypothetical protein
MKMSDYEYIRDIDASYADLERRQELATDLTDDSLMGRDSPVASLEERPLVQISTPGLSGWEWVRNLFKQER